MYILSYSFLILFVERFQNSPTGKLKWPVLPANASSVASSPAARHADITTELGEHAFQIKIF